MSDRQAKFRLVLIVVAAGIGTAMLFRRPASSSSTEHTFEPLVLVETVAPPPEPVEPPPVVTPHLLGAIESEEPPAVRVQAEPVAAVLPEVVSHDILPEPAQPAVTSQVSVQSPPEVATAPSMQPLPPTSVGELPPPNGQGVARVHVARNGDTLSQLAALYLGSARRYRELFEANRDVLKRPDLLPVGVVLKIPAAPVEQAPATTTTAATTGSGLVPIPRGALRRSQPVRATVSRYRVQARQTLVDVARQVYGDGGRAAELFEANRDQLPSPDGLYEGLELLVP